MKKLLFVFILVLAVFCNAENAKKTSAAEKDIAVQLQEIASWESKPLSFTADQKIEARNAVELVLQNHYHPHSMTPQLSSRWYNDYFASLDYNKIFFTQADIDRLRAYESNLYARGHGINLRFAVTVYNLLLIRMQEWVAFSANIADKEFDFTLKEYLPIYEDSRKIPWCKNKAELEQRWCQRTKNYLLVAKLREERRLAKKKDEAAIEPASTPDASSAKPEKKKLSANEKYKKQIIASFRARQNADTSQILEYFLNSFTALMDPHTAYMAPVTKENFDISMGLSLQGIGATLTTRDGYVTIYSLVPGSPASKSGKLHIGDRITAVAQSSTEEPMDAIDVPLDKVVRKIRGKKGTPVFLTVMREGSSTEQIVKIIRDEIELKDAEAQSRVFIRKDEHGKNRKILQIYLPSFYLDFRKVGKKDCKNATTDIEKIIEESSQKGAIDAIILDMRGNGGGSLEEATSIAGLFLGAKSVVQVRSQNDRIKVQHSRQKAIYTGPLVVMVDHFSASATEIVAAALQDYGRALIVGDTRTHGKGSVQSLVGLEDTGMYARWKNILSKSYTPGSVKLTLAKFYRVNGGSTQERGVIPDITFPAFAQYMKTREADLPNALQWDEIESIIPRQSTRMAAQIPILQQVADNYRKTNSTFIAYEKAVMNYKEWREINTLPLEINERRTYNENERKLFKTIRQFQANHQFEEKKKETLKDENDDDMDDDTETKSNDVILDATLVLTDKLIEMHNAKLNP